MKNINIEFIIPTYNRPYQLLTVIGSIASQINPNWRVHVVADCHYEGYDNIKFFFKNEKRIKFSVLDGPHNDWGHTPRIYGLQNATEEWVVMTGDDNYYTPNFVDSFLSVIDDEVNFVYCDMLHNHDTTQCNSYRYFESSPKINFIDIGNFASRTHLSKLIPFNKGSYSADGEFVESYIKKFCNEKNNIKKINKSLYIHN
jgi:glycosyltransferase involved in cell wall biosynthesis